MSFRKLSNWNPKHKIDFRQPPDENQVLNNFSFTSLFAGLGGVHHRFPARIARHLLRWLHHLVHMLLWPPRLGYRH